MLMQFSGDLLLRTHMRMNGSWHIYRPGEIWQRPRHAMRIVVGTDDFVAVGFDIPVAEMLSSRDLDQASRAAPARTGPPRRRASTPPKLRGGFGSAAE